MPIVILFLVRTFRAFAATFRLLVDVRLLRAMPWGYIRRLPFHHVWIGAITVTLTVSLLAALVALAVPGDAGGGLSVVAWWTALAGLASSWVRALVQRRRLRR